MFGRSRKKNHSKKLRMWKTLQEIDGCHTHTLKFYANKSLSDSTFYFVCYAEKRTINRWRYCFSTRACSKQFFCSSRGQQQERHFVSVSFINAVWSFTIIVVLLVEFYRHGAAVAAISYILTTYYIFLSLAEFRLSFYSNITSITVKFQASSTTSSTNRNTLIIDFKTQNCYIDYTDFALTGIRDPAPSLYGEEN